MPASRGEINLLVQEGFESTTIGKILNWALATGRIIVVVVELVVIVAFLSRFWLDRRITDLTEVITQQSAEIGAAANFEQDFKTVKEKIKTFGELSTESQKKAALVDNITASLPADVFLRSISFAEGSVSMRGSALTESGLAGFLLNLESITKLEEVGLAQVSFGVESQQAISFTVNGKIPGEKRAEKQ